MSLVTTAIALSQFAPIISKWIGGNRTESIANTVVNIAKSVTNTNSEKDALNKIRSEVKMANDFQIAIMNAEKEIELAIIKDKENARNRDIAIINNGRRNKRADIMVIAAALGLVVCLLAITLYQKNLPGEAVGIISTIAGIFGSCLKDAYNFEFGSSRGSKEKDHTVANFLNKF